MAVLATSHEATHDFTPAHRGITRASGIDLHRVHGASARRFSLIAALADDDDVVVAEVPE